jgi:hypothetical protein
MAIVFGLALMALSGFFAAANGLVLLTYPPDDFTVFQQIMGFSEAGFGALVGVTGFGLAGVIEALNRNGKAAAERAPAKPGVTNAEG